MAIRLGADPTEEGPAPTRKQHDLRRPAERSWSIVSGLLRTPDTASQWTLPQGRFEVSY